MNVVEIKKKYNVTPQPLTQSFFPKPNHVTKLTVSHVTKTTKVTGHFVLFCTPKTSKTQIIFGHGILLEAK